MPLNSIILYLELSLMSMNSTIAIMQNTVSKDLQSMDNMCIQEQLVALFTHSVTKDVFYKFKCY